MSINHSIQVVLLFAALVRPGVQAQEVRPDNPVDIVFGERLYDGACAACHGLGGAGNGVSARYLNPRPRDLTKGIFRFRSTPSGELPTNEDLFRTTKVGIPGTMMPAFADILTDREIRQTVAYMKTFAPDFQEYAPPPPIEIPPEIKQTAETLAEGKALYMLLACWTCHGPAGRGDGPSAHTLKDDDGLKILPFDFTTGLYKGGSANRDVYRTFITGLDGSPMAAYQESFQFAGGMLTDEAQYKKAYSQTEIEQLKRYMEAQPAEGELGAMSEEARQNLVNHRAWSLVHYVKSLMRKTGFFYWLFGVDTEVTP